MIKEFVERFEAAKPAILEEFRQRHPEQYKDVVATVIRHISGEGGYGNPSPERIHEIDDGDYQGTLIYVIGATGCQPDEYWYVKVGYGSCSGCDTLQAIGNYGSERPTEDQAKQYLTLALHIVQGLKKMGEDEA